ncbi:MAG: patatin-like phospholipase family protein [Bacteroidales bacterium]|nr:patatin-like phospholipase family protein [Bacteroidales bacterium]
MHDKSFERRGHTRCLRNACRSAFAAIAALLLSPALWAQSQQARTPHPNGLSVDSLDPAGDAVAIARMRERMDSIHINQHRPTVALVLSGGGAKGAAHVGVLRYLEEHNIPIDLICGTSMGGLVGGMTALGYDSAYLDSLLRAQDWLTMLTDRIDPSYYSYNRKVYRETYLLSIPFYYSKKDFQSRIDDQVRYFDDGARSTFGENSLASSLPSGYVYGFNVNNLISSVSVGYQDNMDFSELPIPFFCVAADLVSMKAKNWTKGSFKDAMRSTMSIPGLFKPVRSRGEILVDGGVRNNFPVDIARAMGADLVIGVDLSDLDLTYSQVNNIGDIVMQFVSMLGKDSFDQNVESADVFIKPDLKGYNMMSFTPVAIDTMIHRGYVAASMKADEIAEIEKIVGDVPKTIGARKATDIAETPVHVYAVEFEGLSNSESRFLQRKIGFKAGSAVDRKKMEDMMSRIEATGCFSSVTYSLLGKEEPYRLVFNCAKGPRHQFGVGVRFDTEEWPSFLFNIGLNEHKISGLKLNVDAKIGRNSKLTARGMLDLWWLPTVNAEASISTTSSTLVTDLGKVGEGARWWGHSEKLYLSNIRWTSVDFKLGAQYRQYILPGDNSYGAYIGSVYPDNTNGGYLGLFADGKLYTMDRLHYPRKGVKLTFGYEYDFLKKDCESFKPLHTAYLNFTPVVPLGGRVAIIPDLHLRALLGSAAGPDVYGNDPGYSFAHQNYIGGSIPGRYIDGQMPFIGFGDVYQADPYAAVLNLSLRVEPFKNFFVTATGGYLREAPTPKDFITSVLPTTWGAGLELGYSTPLGPVKVLGTWSDRFKTLEKDLGFYLSLGFDF